MSVPTSLQPYLWSVSVDHLDVKKDKEYIVHQLLHYGDLDAIAWLKKTYSVTQLQTLFQQVPKKIYTDRSFQFVTNFLLNLTDRGLDPSRYVRK